MSMDYTILEQIEELPDGSVTVPLFRTNTVKESFDGVPDVNKDGIGYDVSYRMEMTKESTLDYHITVLIGDRRIETSEPNDVIFGTWYPRGPKGWTNKLIETGADRSKSVLDVLGSPDYLQSVKFNTQDYRDLMKGYKADSLSGSPEGPM